MIAPSLGPPVIKKTTKKQVAEALKIIVAVSPTKTTYISIVSISVE